MPGLESGVDHRGVLTVDIARPGGLLTVADCQELTATLLAPPVGVTAFRLRSSGEAFCLGRERAGTTPGELREESEVLVGLHRALDGTRLLTVAEVSGDAAGFGVGVVASCDLAVAVASSQFSFPEAGIGLAPALVLAWLPALVGEREAFWLTATGLPIDAVRARELGLVNHVVAGAPELVGTTDRSIDAVLRHGSRVHSEIRSMVRAGRALTRDQAFDLSVDRLVVGSLRRGEQPG
ncbi:enoyl-CoA hydratase/isomerase family protein [Microlunatus antarcticus]|uniref:Enoyl-CoA hydratase/carnithine racemase n=1 Tax=Microlunatus antarcticus TaxID=53388 RepID=A0A7W5JSZ3_9ACTN|nr:enoyl-CoA hydratase/isomerase family protein [Microlunatus antarcticus]MBB3325786.1 enoyl-CoA hydratase/carnithine racemase [Microlunatus antarcticus]